MPGEGNVRVAFEAGSRVVDSDLVLPEPSGARHPAVLVVHEIFGVDGHIRDVAGRFARAGYVAVAPNLFPGEVQRLLTPANIGLAMQAFAGAPQGIRRDPGKLAAFAQSQPPERRPILEAFGRVMNPDAQQGFALDLLGVARRVRQHPEVDPARTAAVGFCFGGGMVGRLATLDPELRAGVIFYGQNPPLEDVPKIRAALLGLYAGEDPGITGSVPLLAEAMARGGHRFDYHVYPGVRHAFFNDTRPQVHHAESARDAWSRVLAFLGRELAP